jgi:hypothetical protein
MKTEDRYLKFVRWSDEDGVYIGYCPDLFPWGGVCHAETEEQAYHQLCVLVSEEIQSLQSESKELPHPVTRPMREVESVA